MIAPNSGLASGKMTGGLSIPTADPLRSRSGSRVLAAARVPDGITSTQATAGLIFLAVAAIIPRVTDLVPVFTGVRGSAGGNMGGRPDDDI